MRYSAEDARRGAFETLVIEDACRGIDVGGSMAHTRQALAAMSVPLVSSHSIG